MLRKIFKKPAAARRFRRMMVFTAIVGTVAAGVYKAKKYLLETARQAWATQYPEDPRPDIKDPGFDAFRHAYTSARLTQCFGPAAARAMMDGNEVFFFNAAAERRKDAYNNDRGAEAWGQDKFSGFGKVDTNLAEKISAAIGDSTLKTDTAAVPPGYRHDYFYFF